MIPEDALRKAVAKSRDPGNQEWETAFPSRRSLVAPFALSLFFWPIR